MDTTEDTTDIDELTQALSSMTIIEAPGPKTRKSKINAADIASVKLINDRIVAEICFDTIKALSDESLMHIYRTTPCVKILVEKTLRSLERSGVTDVAQRNLIVENLMIDNPHIIPAGVKGAIRGNKFNKIVRDVILALGLDAAKFEIVFEKKCSLLETSEIPDWYIREIATTKIIIGMNQIDLWSGGQQTNRGDKYINNATINTPTSKLLCVVCNEVKIVRAGKVGPYKLFNKGFADDTLCYIKNIGPIVKKFFEIE